MSDLDLLHVLRKQEAYNKYARFVQPHNVTKETRVIIQDMEEYFKVISPQTEIDWDTFATWFKNVKHSSFKEDVVVLYDAIFSNLNTITTSVIEKDLIESFIEKDFLTRIADVSLKSIDGTTPAHITDIKVLCDEYDTTVGAVDEVEKFIVDDDVHALLAKVVKGTGLNWRLNELNVSAAPLRKGDFVTLTARPDSGKTTFLASESTFMAGQLPSDEHVIWFNNEEEGGKVKFRILQAALGWTSKDIEDDPTYAWALYEKILGNVRKIIVYDRPSISITDVDIVLKKYKPGLIIFDQLRKVKGFEKEAANDVGRLQLLFQQGREWAKQYAPVINVHQARGDAEGQRWIEQNQLHGSQTDIQGEVDLLVSLGRTHEPGFEYTRFLYTPKNKMTPGPKSDPKHRNAKWEITIEPEIARFKGTI